MAILFKTSSFQPGDNLGGIMPGPKLYFYQSGTTTLIDVYSDAGERAAFTNPVIADGYGRFPAVFVSIATYNFCAF